MNHHGKKNISTKNKLRLPSPPLDITDANFLDPKQNQDFWLTVEHFCTSSHLLKNVQQECGLSLSLSAQAFIGRELLIYFREHCRFTVKPSNKAAMRRLSQATRRYLAAIDSFTISGREADRLAYKDFVGFMDNSGAAYHVGFPQPNYISKTEARLRDLCDYLDLRSVSSKGARKKDRERIFWALVLIFEVSGGRPTVSYTDATGNIDSAFVRFCECIIGGMPKIVRRTLNSGFRSAMRQQWKIWRDDPQRYYAPNNNMGRSCAGFMLRCPDHKGCLRTDWLDPLRTQGLDPTA